MTIDVKALIAEARAKVDAPETARVDVLLGVTAISLEFSKIRGHEWADLTASNPPRVGARLDENVGFNSDGVAAAYPSVVLLDGDAKQPLDAATWAEMFAVFDSPAIKNVAAALWGLNQLDPTKRFLEAKKAMAGASGKKQN